MQLKRQDKQGAKLGANCNTADFGSQPSFQLLIYFCPNFPPTSPSSRCFWADHNTHRGEERRTAAWPSACPRQIQASPLSSPTPPGVTGSQAWQRNLLLLFLLQTLKPTGKPEFNLTAAEYSWINPRRPNKILLLKCNLCLAPNTLGEFRAICTADQLGTLRKARFDAPDLHLTALMHFGNRQ